MVRFRQGNRRRPDRREQIRGAARASGRIVARVVPYVFLALVALGLPYLIVQAYVHTISSQYFSVDIIEVEGFFHVDSVRALEEAGVVRGSNVFTLDRGRAEAQLVQHPFIASARVERRLPDTMRVVVVEHEAVAVIVDESFWLVDEKGKPFMSLDVSIWAGNFDDLPLISGIRLTDLETTEGRESMGQAMEVARLYRELELDRRQPLSQIHVDPLMGLSLVTEETGTEIRLGKGRWRERLQRLEVVQSSLIERGLDADYVLIDQEEDLSRVAVGWRIEPGNGESAPLEAP
ncbi:MAG: cell division protein FtsQ/DivIB [Bradymonadaceae bacterium]